MKRGGARSRRPTTRKPTRTKPRWWQPTPSARDFIIEIALRQYDARRDLARRDPKKVRALFRDHPSVISDLGLPSWQGPGRRKGSSRVLGKHDLKDFLIWSARALGLNDPQICRDLGRKYNAAARRYITAAIRRVSSDKLFARRRTQITEQNQTRQQIGAALRALPRR